MAAWEGGRTSIEYLLGKGRLEPVAGVGTDRAAELIMIRAERRLSTAAAGLDLGDVDGAFVAAYDAYRMAAESLLVCQGLRATGGDGSHMTVEDAISAQFASEIGSFAKPTFERFHRTRHTAQYFDPDAAEITGDDAGWAITTARAAVVGTRAISERLSLFDPS